MLCAAVAYPAFELVKHPNANVASFTWGDLWRYLILTIAVATFFTSLLAGWCWDGILGDKRKSLVKIFIICAVAFLVLFVGPVLVAVSLGKNDAWVEDIRTYSMMAIMFWQVIAELRKGRADPSIDTSLLETANDDVSRFHYKCGWCSLASD